MPKSAKQKLTTASYEINPYPFYHSTEIQAKRALEKINMDLDRLRSQFGSEVAQRLHKPSPQILNFPSTEVINWGGLIDLKVTVEPLNNSEPKACSSKSGNNDIKSLDSDSKTDTMLPLSPPEAPTYDVSINQSPSRNFAEKRLIRDMQELLGENLPGIFASPIDDDLFLWTTVITGPEYSPYEGGIFKGLIQFTSEYPYVPPTLTFTSNIFHPNISENGLVCFDGYSKKWSPGFSLSSFLMAVKYLLAEPSTISPANEIAATTLDTNIDCYLEIVKDCVKLSLQEN